MDEATVAQTSDQGGQGRDLVRLLIETMETTVGIIVAADIMMATVLEVETTVVVAHTLEAGTIITIGQAASCTPAIRIKGGIATTKDEVAITAVINTTM